MIFPKINGRPYKVILNKAEERIMRDEINKSILHAMREAEKDGDATYLLILHDHYGFSVKKLKNIWKMLYTENKKYEKYYELEPGEGLWYARRRLKEVGIDLDAWYNEEQANGPI